jgi:hypothetical protein
MKYVLMVVATLGLVVPLSLGAVIGLTPDALLRDGSAGQFVLASSSAGGFFNSSVTSVQTTIGTVAVFGSFSALRGQELRVTDRLKSGTRLCVADQPSTCSVLAGVWPGKLDVAAGKRPWTTPLVSRIGVQGVTQWSALGLLLTIVTGLMTLAASAPEPEPEPEP